MTIPLWPAGTPGITPGNAGEHDITTPNDGLTGGAPVVRLTDVSGPSITVYRPSKGRGNGTGVVVFPGGGYSILAMDLEGIEVCRWLNAIGVTAMLLKYRVPDPPPHAKAFEDAQRAMGLARLHARQWDLDEFRIGVLGFSAGGHLAASLSCGFHEREYGPVDDADRLSCRPDFTVLVYPAYLVAGGTEFTLDSAIRPSGDTPPAFIVQTQDDPFGVNNSIAYYTALLRAGGKCEMHLYEKGGHGYGLRPSTLPVSRWPVRLEEWLQSNGITSDRASA
jgi:acetyl esterase/lipase